MNPNETSQHQKRQADHNLDESQSSSVSIKIFNKNDDNVVIRLYRNNTKTSRDRFKNSSGHTRQGAGGCERKDKRKPTMFRNLYRNTFGPTIDETVLVGMETFHICQQDANTSCNSGCNDPHTSNEDFGTNRNSIIPNELSWDCSTLLPTNNNEKHYESVCTNTSDYALDKEMDLCPQLTNQYQYNPFCDKNQNKTSCPHSPSSKAFNQGNGSNEEAEETCPMNNISSDENLTFCPNSRRRSSFNREKPNLKEKQPEHYPNKKGIRSCFRKSSGSDTPSPCTSYHEAVPRNYRRSSSRSPSCMHESLEEGPESFKCSTEEHPRRNSSFTQSKRCTFNKTSPRNSNTRGPSISSQPLEENLRANSFVADEDFDEDSRRSSGLRGSFLEGTNKEPLRKVSSRIADYFRKHSRKPTTVRKSSFSAKSVDGYIRTETNEEMPRVSTISTPSYESGQRNSTISSPRRSSLPRESSNEEGEKITPRNSTENRQSKVKRKMCENSPQECKIVDKETEEFRDVPRRPTESADIYKSGRLKCGRSSTPRRSSSPLKSLNEGFEGNRRNSAFSQTSNPDESNEIEGYIRTELNEDTPHISTVSEQSIETEHPTYGRPSMPQRSDKSRKSFYEGVSGNLQEVGLSRFSVDGQRRESKGSHDDVPCVSCVSPEINETQHEEGRQSSNPRTSFKRESFQKADIPKQEDASYTINCKNFTENLRSSVEHPSPRKCKGYPASLEEKPMVSTFSPENTGFEEDYPCCSNRRKSRQTSKRATITLKTDTESRKESCRCEKEKLNRNNTPQETRYAITRVTKYDDYTTYEILKSTRARPKKIPEVLEKIFIEKDL